VVKIQISLEKLKKNKIGVVIMNNNNNLLEVGRE